MPTIDPTATLDALHHAVSEAANDVRDVADLVKAVLVDQWLEAGGCTTCSGEGQVVTFFTLDGPGWTEHGPCPGPSTTVCGACGETGHSQYDRIGDYIHRLDARLSKVRTENDPHCTAPRGDGAHVPDSRRSLGPCTAAKAGIRPCSEFVADMTKSFYAIPVSYRTPELLAAQAKLEAAEAAVAAEQDRIKIQRGKTVEVYKGRKFAVGTRGVVFWTGESQFGDRVGIELATGERVFVAADNVYVPPAATLAVKGAR